MKHARCTIETIFAHVLGCDVKRLNFVHIDTSIAKMLYDYWGWQNIEKNSYRDTNYYQEFF